jgi:hypothetical protein
MTDSLTKHHSPSTSNFSPWSPTATTSPASLPQTAKKPSKSTRRPAKHPLPTTKRHPHPQQQYQHQNLQKQLHPPRTSSKILPAPMSSSSTSTCQSWTASKPPAKFDNSKSKQTLLGPSSSPSRGWETTLLGRRLTSMGLTTSCRSRCGRSI